MSGILVLASFLMFTTANAQFEDIATTHPYYHAVTALSEAGVIEGYLQDGQRYYKPTKPINRAEALKILMLSANIEILENDPERFPDVPFSAWFSRYINSAAEKNIVKGFQDGYFYPDAQVTRVEFLKMVSNSFGFPDPEDEVGDEWFDPYLRAGKKYRVISGDDLRPHEALKRGDVAEIIFRSQWVAEHYFEEKYTYAGSGTASYYNDGFAGKPTANGETYDPTALTAAHRTLPFGTRLKVWNNDGDVVFVRINDRGPYHKERILDLSQSAFEQLAPSGQGIVDVYFEVVTTPTDEQISIPANIRSNLEEGTKNELVPDVITNVLSKPVASIIPENIIEHVTNDPSIYEHEVEKAKTIKVQPLFKDGVNSLSETFFDKAVLRRDLHQKVLQGTVIRLAGIADKTGYEKAVFFLENTETGKQRHFEGDISGKNFEIPVQFLDLGTFHLGLVFDNQQKSKIAKIEVLELPSGPRWFPSSKLTFMGNDFEVEVKPEDEMVLLKWESDTSRLTRINFLQQENEKVLYLENGLTEVLVPYDFFREFSTGENLAIDFYQAQTLDGTMQTQNTNWKKGPYSNFDLTFGFPDNESEKVGVPKFSRFVHKLKPLTIEGEIFDKTVGLPENVFFITPDGEVNQFPLVRRGSQFQARVSPLTWGPHIFELVSDEGEVLFNRAIYFSPNQILPIFPWPQMMVKSNTRGEVLAWINRLRNQQKKPLLVGSAQLDRFAQSYADEMADNSFISHTDTQGRDFQSRITAWGLEGELGENLSYGSNFPLALEGLENSASHRKNLLEKKWKKVGVGIAKNKKGDYYVAQLFGR